MCSTFCHAFTLITSIFGLFFYFFYDKSFLSNPERQTMTHAELHEGVVISYFNKFQRISIEYSLLGLKSVSYCIQLFFCLLPSV